MTEAIKFPSARQPATEVVGGQEVFTRPWFLFFQQLYMRTGGAIGENSNDIIASLFEDAGTGEVQAQLQTLTNAVGQEPPLVDVSSLDPVSQDPDPLGSIPALIAQVEQMAAELSAQRDLVAELTKEVDALRQGQML